MSRHFNVHREYEAKFGHQLTPAQAARADTLAELGDPGRDFHGSAVIVTCFLRPGDNGVHGDGWADDLQPAVGGEREIRALAAFYAALYRPGTRGSPLLQVIYEAPEPHQIRGHVHRVLAGCPTPGVTPGYLVDVEGNQNYVRLPLPRIVVQGA